MMAPGDALIDAIADAVVARMKPALEAAQAVRPRLLTVEQAATYIGRTSRAVRGLLERRTFSQVKGDGRVMLDIQDLDRWIAQSKS